MAKYPWIKFFPGDWLKDPSLSMCSAATRGLWIDAICAMHESDRSFSLTGTPDQLARVLRCAPSEVSAALSELRLTKAADVRECNGVVTLICRRLQLEYKERLATAKRVQKHRCNGDETRMKRRCNAEKSEVRSQKSEIPPLPPRGGMAGFERFWAAWPKHPRKVGKNQCLEWWKRKGADGSLDAIIAALERAKLSADWKKEAGAFIPQPRSWLNKTPWETDPKDLANGPSTGPMPTGLPTREESDGQEWMQRAAPEERQAIVRRIVEEATAKGRQDIAATVLSRPPEINRLVYLIAGRWLRQGKLTSIAAGAA